MRWPIRHQLLVPLLVLLLGTVVVSGWVAFGTAAQARTAIEERVRHVARALAESPQFPLVPSVLEQMKQLSGADYLLIGGGTEVSTLTTPPDNSPPAEAVVDDWRTVRLGPPLTIAGERYRCSGLRLRPPHEGQTLYILYPESLWRNALWNALGPVAAIGGTTALAALLLAFGLGQRLTGRVRELERRTRGIAAGDFSPMPLPDRDDEVRDLTLAVNAMADQLSRFQETMLRTERLRLLGQVGGGLAHQLRNGLTGARLALQVFLQEQGDGTDTAALDVALRQLTLLETQLKRFLELGRSDDTPRERLDLASVMDEAVELLRPQCRHAGIALRWDALSPACSVLGDRGQLAQLLVNLLTNAIEAAGPGGSVAIQQFETRSPGGDKLAVIEVADTGPGPAPSVADRLFEPFITGKPEGIGLGLAVARQVAEAHDGRLEWRRDAGQTVFRLEMPLAADERA